MRARRFAGLYMNEDPEAINYDPVHKIILSPRTGSRGPHYHDENVKPGPSRASERYGLPAYDSSRKLHPGRTPKMTRRPNAWVR